MTKVNPISSTSLLKSVIILIICSVIFSCSSNRIADVNERSSHLYRGKVHTVAQGETLFSIAWKYGVDYKKLAVFNDIKPPYTIYPSQKLRLDSHMFKVKMSGSSNPELAGNSNGNNSDKKNKKSSEKRSKNTVSSPSIDNFLSSPKWQWPASGKLIALFQGDSGVNKGIDLVGKLGEPVLAAASGRVVYAGSGLSGYGKLLILKHSEIFLSAYAHNSELLVREGDFIKGGQRIADMGSSGTDRVKLHFEIRSEGSPVDPLKYLPKRQ